METHLALLRGINVSGQKLIRMQDLRKLMSDAGFKNVSTYIQSGNLIFQSAEKSQDKLAEIVSKLIKKTYGWDVGILMLNQEKLQKIINSNPFLKDEHVDLKKIYVAFLSAIPEKENVEKFNRANVDDDIAVLSENTMYLKYAVGAGKTRLSNALIENKLQVTATIRNWNTTLKLAELLSQTK